VAFSDTMEMPFGRYVRPVWDFGWNLAATPFRGVTSNRHKGLVKKIQTALKQPEVSKMPIPQSMNGALRTWEKAYKRVKRSKNKTKYEKAAEELELAFANNNSFCVPAYFAAALAYEALGDTAGAVKKLNLILDMQPPGDVLRRDREKQRADPQRQPRVHPLSSGLVSLVQKYRDRLVNVPSAAGKPVVVYEKRGHTATRSGNYTAAVENLEIALAISPYSYTARLELVKALDQQAEKTSNSKAKKALEARVRREASYAYALGARDGTDEELLLKAMDIDKPEYGRKVVINLDNVPVYDEEATMDEFLEGRYGRKNRAYSSAERKTARAVIKNTRHRLNADPDKKMARAIKRLNKRDTQVVLVTEQTGAPLRYTQIWAQSHFGNGVQVQSIPTSERRKLFKEPHVVAYLGGKGGEGRRADPTLRYALEKGIDSYLLRSTGATHDEATRTRLFTFAWTA
jgi:tetratricopeptide (TPR) repeat protein